MKGGFVTQPWGWFFNFVQKRLYALGVERSFDLVNNQSSAADVTGLRLDKRGVTCAVMEYLVQRITTGGSAVELTEFGMLAFVWNPTSASWTKVTIHEEDPDDAGVTFTITTTGQVQYTTTNASGDPSISKLFYMVRTMAGKNTQYSSVGAK